MLMSAKLEQDATDAGPRAGVFLLLFLLLLFVLVVVVGELNFNGIITLDKFKFNIISSLFSLLVSIS